MNDRPAKAGEAEIIELLTRGMIRDDRGVVLGAGDDCAILASGDGRVTLITTDMQIEGTHFQTKYTLPQELGRRALAINLSDIAAMGGTPRHAFLALSLPDEVAETSFFEGLRQGMASVAEEFEVNLLGGDLARSRSGIGITLTVIGEADADKVLLRSGAWPGDYIYVTGTLGDAAAGLELLQQGSGLSRRGPLERAQLMPSARIREGQFLSGCGWVHACIDLSDGLSTDLSHLCARSKVGARVFEDEIPVSAEFLQHINGDAGRKLNLACHGGEDYELCFTAACKHGSELERAFAERFQTRLTRIGEIRDEPKEIELVGRLGSVRFLARGHDHFAKPRGA